MSTFLTRAGVFTGMTGALILSGIITAPAATAADQPEIATIPPSASGIVNFTYRMDGIGFSRLDLGRQPWVFNAPAHTTFPAQATVPTARINSDTAAFVPYNPDVFALRDCVVGNAGKTLTCDATVAGGIAIPATIRLQFSPTLKVDTEAPAGTYSATSNVNYTGTRTDTDTTGNYTIAGTLNVTIPEEVPAPLVNPAIAGGAGVVAAATLATFHVLRRRRAAV